MRIFKQRYLKGYKKFTNFEQIQPDTVIRDTALWQWLKVNYDAYHRKANVEMVAEYLSDHGFIVGIHKVDSEQLKIHCNIVKHYYFTVYIIN